MGFAVCVQGISGDLLYLYISMSHPVTCAKDLAIEDAPDGHDEVLVTRPKSSASICSACFYTQRGSFPKVSQQELEKSKKEHPPVEAKHLGQI